MRHGNQKLRDHAGIRAGTVAIVGTLVLGCLVVSASTASTAAHLADHPDASDIGLDASLPVRDAIIGAIDTDGTANGVVLVDHYALVADGEAWLQVIDVADPGAPALVGWGATFDNAYALAYDKRFDADHIFLAIGGSGLQISNVENPSDPVLVSSLDTPGLAVFVVLAGKLACVADYTAGVQIFDVSSPVAPRLIGSVDTPGYAHALAAAQSHLYVADGIAGLQIIDLTNPSQPRPVGGITTPGYAVSVDLRENFAYVADSLNGRILVLDVAIPSAPALTATVELFARPSRVSVVEDRLYVTTRNNGVLVFVLTTPTAPVLVDRFATPGEGKAAIRMRDWLLVADGSCGLQIARLADLAAQAAFPQH